MKTSVGPLCCRTLSIRLTFSSPKGHKGPTMTQTIYDQEAQWEQTDEMYRQLQAFVVEAVAQQATCPWNRTNRHAIRNLADRLALEALWTRRRALPIPVLV